MQDKIVDRITDEVWGSHVHRWLITLPGLAAHGSQKIMFVNEDDIYILPHDLNVDLRKVFIKIGEEVLS